MKLNTFGINGLDQLKLYQFHCVNLLTLKP